ncbi:hypothetical protein D3C73_971130 [compost metagenome]
MKRYSEMTSEELHKEIASLIHQKQHAELPSQLAILDSKIYTAQSYGLSKENFPPGPYQVIGYASIMQVTYLNGMMAWGTMDGEEASFPLAMLKRIN